MTALKYQLIAYIQELNWRVQLKENKINDPHNFGKQKKQS